MGEQTTLEEFIAKYGDDNGRFLYEQFSSFRQRYSGLTYISSGVASDATCRAQARNEAGRQGWAFQEVAGSLTLLDRLVNGPWDADGFLVLPPGARIRATFKNDIVGAL